MATQDLGRLGERAARRILRRRGYKVLATNWRCPFGELDVVALHRGVLCFVEVKTQTAGTSVAPAEEVSPLKQARMSRAAAEFLRRTGALERPARFDVVTVVMDGRRQASVEVITDAFSGAGPYG